MDGHRLVLVNGVNLNVKTVGSGPTIVALHGFTSDMSTWTEFAAEAKNRYTVITPDLLGHGSSEAPNAVARYQIEHTVIDVAAIIRGSGFQQACWLGYSMGGRIALAAAALIPDACSSLVIEGASPGLRSPNARARRQKKDEALANRILSEGIEKFTARWAEQPLFGSQKSLPIDIQERIRNQRLKSNPVGLANTLRAAGPGVQPPVHEFLPNIKIPALCIVGEYDHKFTSIARRMCSKLNDGRIEIIPGAGHAAHLEKPREFNAAVFAFLEKICA